MVRAGSINPANAVTAYLKAAAFDHGIEPERQAAQDLITARRDEVIRDLKAAGVDKAAAFEMFRTALREDPSLPDLSVEEFDRLYDALSLQP